MKSTSPEKKTRNTLVWIVLTATVAAAIPVAVYLILVGQTEEKKLPPARAPGTSASGDLEQLARDESLVREPILLQVGEARLFEAADLSKDAGTPTALTSRARLWVAPLFTERKANLDDGISRLFAALPAGTESIASQRLEVFLFERGVADEEAVPDLVVAGSVALRSGAFQMAGTWQSGGAACSMELTYTFRSGLLFAKYDCPTDKLFQVPFLPEPTRISLTSLNLTSSSYLQIGGMRLVDSENSRELFAAQGARFTAQKAVDRRVFAAGLSRASLAREKSWKLELEGVVTDLSSMHLLPVFGGFEGLPAARISVSSVEADSAGNLRLVKPDVRVAELGRIRAGAVDFADDGHRRIFAVTEPRLEEDRFGLSLTAAEAVVEQDEYRTFWVSMDGFKMGVSSNPLKLAKLVGLGAKLKEVVGKIQESDFEVPPLVLPEGFPDLRLSAKNGEVHLPMLKGRRVTGLGLSAVVRGGMLEKADIEMCIGKPGKKCDELDFKAGLSTDSVGELSEINIRAGGALPVRQLKKRMPEAVKDIGSLEVSCQVQATEAATRLSAEFEVVVREASVFHKRLADQPITFPLVRAVGAAQVNLKEQTLELNLSKLQMDRVFFRVVADVARFSGLPRLSFTLDFPEQNCHSLLKSAPQGFARLLDSARLSGSIWFKVGFTVDMKDIRKSIKLEIDGDWDRCKAVWLGRDYDVEKLNDPALVHQVSVNGEDLGIEVGPGTVEYIGLARIPSVVQAAAYGTEDLAFYRHKGFRVGLIRRAIILYLERGYFAYGGSTISQQLVKNMFLSRHKTLSRKFQEAVIVWNMERKLTKDRIFELYLNCIEYGPKIWGITRAARIYFGKRVQQLAPIEAAFLMGLKPDPAYGYLQYRRGKLNKHWRQNLDRVLKRLLDMGAMSQAQFDLAMRSKLRFRTPGTKAKAEADSDEDRPVRTGQEEL